MLKIRPTGQSHTITDMESGRDIASLDTRSEAIAALGKLYVGTDKASAPSKIACFEESCERAFLEFGGMVEHAEAVHTFDDIRSMVAEKVRETYAKRGDYKAIPPVSSIWAWVVDLATDWVVFTVEQDTDSTLFKASYSITDNAVTLGAPVEVVRKTVYEPITKES